jgi:DNA repair/transcription protein MET18/MMS19
MKTDGYGCLTHSPTFTGPMDLSGLTLSPQPSLEEAVNCYCDPRAERDEHRDALNSILLQVHQAREGGFGQLLAGPLGPHLKCDEPKRRGRASLLIAEVLVRLSALPLSEEALGPIFEFLLARLGDTPSIESSLVGIRALFSAHHAPKLPACAASEVWQAVIVGKEWDLSSLPQPCRRAGMDLVESILQCPRDDFRLGILQGGRETITSFLRAGEGEHDPRPLSHFLNIMTLLETGCDADAVKACSQEIFDGLSCYFPVSFNPPPNDTRGVSSEVLEAALQKAMFASPFLAPHVLPMLAENVTVDISVHRTASIAALPGAFSAYGLAACREHVSMVGHVLWEGAVQWSEPEPVLGCIGQLARELPSDYRSWEHFQSALIDPALRELALNAGSLVGRRGSLVLAAISSSSVAGMRSVWSRAGDTLLAAHERAAHSSVRQAALHSIVTLLEAIDDEVDVTPSPIAPYASEIYRVLMAQLHDSVSSGLKEGDGGEGSSDPAELQCLAIAGLCALAWRPPSPLLSQDEVRSMMRRLTEVLLAGQGRDLPIGGAAGAYDAADVTATAALNALRVISTQRHELAPLLLKTAVTSLCRSLSALSIVGGATPGLKRALYSLQVLSSVPAAFSAASSAMLDCAITSGTQGPVAAAALEYLAKAVSGAVLASVKGFCVESLPALLDVIGKGCASKECTSSAVSITHTCVRVMDEAEQDALLLRLMRDEIPAMYPILAAALGSSKSSSCAFVSRELLGPIFKTLQERALAGDLACCHCIAAILNKSPNGEARHAALCAVTQDLKVGGVGAVPLLLWSCRALAMRGEMTRAGLDGGCSAISLLDILTSFVQAGNVAAADSMSSLACETEVLCSVGNARTSPLWKQRLFAAAFSRLQEDTNATAALAVLRLCSGVPTSILQSEISPIMLVIAMAIRDPSDDGLRLAALELLTSLSRAIPSAVLPHLNIFVPALLSVSAEGDRARIRAMAVDGLLSFASLPYTKLHPYKNTVTRGLIPALDDPKRSVRQAAVSCRNRWYVLDGSSS